MFSGDEFAHQTMVIIICLSYSSEKYVKIAFIILPEDVSKANIEAIIVILAMVERIILPLLLFIFVNHNYLFLSWRVVRTHYMILPCRRNCILGEYAFI